MNVPRKEEDIEMNIEWCVMMVARVVSLGLKLDMKILRFIMNALKREAVESDRKEAQEQAWKQAMMRNAQDEER